MPRAPKACSSPGCPNLAPCTTHRRTPWAGSTRRATLPPDWAGRKRRRHQLDNWTCVDCGWHDPTGRTLDCDHTGDRDDHRIASLRTRCNERANGCHRRRTQRQAAEARAARPSRRRADPPHPGLI